MADFDFDYIMRHMTSWLEHTVHESERREARSDIMRALANDPTIYERGWPAVRDFGRRLRS